MAANTIGDNKKRDAVVADKSPSSGSGSMSNASAGRVRSLPSSDANFTSPKDLAQGFPAPDSPYGKGE